jgi:tetratricopeptide (TPR) repeat protein
MLSTRRLLATLIALCLLGLVSGCASEPPPSATDLGERALAEGDWRSAKSHFAEALRMDSIDGRAWLGQARAQLAGRDPEGALRSLSSLSQADPERFRQEGQETYGDSLESAGVRRLDRKQTEAALGAVRALKKLEPSRPRLDRLLGRALVAEADRRRLAGDRKTALAFYLEACAETPQSLEAWIGAAEILLEQNETGQAMSLLESARRSHPTAGAIRSLTLQVLQTR